MTIRTATPETDTEMYAIIDRTARRTRRVRCSDCSELFPRERLTNGQCSACASVVEMTDPATGETFLARTEPTYLTDVDRGELGFALVATTSQSETVERRCQGCQEWTPTDQLVDELCGSCQHVDRVLAETAGVADQLCEECGEPASAERGSLADPDLIGLLFHEGCHVETEEDSEPVATPEIVVTPEAPARERKLWNVVTVDHGFETIAAGPMSFDECQVFAKHHAKGIARMTSVKAKWLDVKRWQANEDTFVVLMPAY